MELQSCLVNRLNGTKSKSNVIYYNKKYTHCIFIFLSIKTDIKLAKWTLTTENIQPLLTTHTMQ